MVDSSNLALIVFCSVDINTNDPDLQSDSPGDTDTLQSKKKNERKAQKVIQSYYSLGKAIRDRFDHYKKLGNKEHTAHALVNEEIREHHPNILYVKETAQKIYDFFNEIGEDNTTTKFARTTEKQNPSLCI
ncbi:13362_t:CDS:2 [Entrophospora sp. SA101]|nr:13362_t:CDS:2 [Entrophospora sp. SA101]